MPGPGRDLNYFYCRGRDFLYCRAGIKNFKITGARASPGPEKLKMPGLGTGRDRKASLPAPPNQLSHSKRLCRFYQRETGMSFGANALFRKKSAPTGRRPNSSVAASHTEKPPPIPVDASSGLRKLAGTRLADLKSPGPERKIDFFSKNSS